MADNKKDDKPDMTFTKAQNLNDWIEAYYGMDHLDYGKVDKIKHVGRVAQFASVCYYVGKNSKSAHTDFFESNYTASSVTIANVSELIIKLLQTSAAGGGRRLTRTDFIACGGGTIFNPTNPEFDKIVEDYIGDGGLVSQCAQLFPIHTDTGKNQKMFDGLVNDMDEIKKDHSSLLQLTTDGKQTAMSLKDILSMRYMITERAQNQWHKIKKAKSTSEFDLKDSKEELFEDKRDLAFKTGKVATLCGTSMMSLGAIVGGTFWPVLLFIPVYALGKKWVPEFFKSMGKTWGEIEKERKLKRKINRADAQLEYLNYWAKNGKAPKMNELSRKTRWFLRGADLTCLKKQGKQMQAAITTIDEEVYDPVTGTTKKVKKLSEIDQVFNAISKKAGVVSDVTATDELVPADVLPMLNGKLDALIKKPESSTFNEFLNIAQMYKNYESKIPGDKLQFQQKYGETLKKCAEHLIFETPMDSLTRFNDNIKNRFGDESPLFDVCKITSVEEIEQIKRWTALASKELTGIEEVDGSGASKWQGKTLKEYIFRAPASKLTEDEVKVGLTIGSDDDLRKAIEYIANLEIKVGGEFEGFRPYFVSKLNGSTDYVTLKEITETIGKIANSDAVNLCNEKLNKQMSIVSAEKSRKDSQVTYNTITGDSLGGKPAVTNLSELFKKISEIKYETVGSSTVSEIYNNISTIKIPEVRDYLHGKLSKAVYDVFNNYATANENTNKFKTDLKALAELLKNINASTYLDEQQKQKLSLLVKPYISDALNQTSWKVSANFGAYKIEEWKGYAKYSYANAGFKTLFDTDKTTEVQEIQKKMNFMASLQGVKDSLNFGEYGISSVDRNIIIEILLRNNNGNFEKLITREADDKLFAFLRDDLAGGRNQIIQATKMTHKNVFNESRYGLISESLGDIVGKKLDENESEVNVTDYKFKNVNDYDKYAALIALKTRYCREFEDFLYNNIRNQAGSISDSQYLQTTDGMNYWNKIIEAWRPLADKIDTEMDNVKQKLGLTSSTTKLSQFLDNYNTPDSSKVKITKRVNAAQMGE